MGSHYKVSPPGEGLHVWVNKPDTKFQADGLYHFKLGVTGDAAQSFKEEIASLADAAFEAATKGKDPETGKPRMTPAEAKKWSVYYPFEEEEDEDGNPTGRVWFIFKQNAIIYLKDGTKKKFAPGVRDAADNAIKDTIYGGDTIRACWKERVTRMPSSKQIGVRLDFAFVQLLKKGQRSGGGGSLGDFKFGAVEGGYVSQDGGSEDNEAPFDLNDEGADEADY